jgi:hypothetical protein
MGIGFDRHIFGELLGSVAGCRGSDLAVTLAGVAVRAIRGFVRAGADLALSRG